MMNNTYLVGRLVSEPKLEKLADGREVVDIEIAVPRSYKNDKGEYETDLIPCNLNGNLFSRMKDYLKKDDLVGVRGTLQSSYREVDGKKVPTIKLVADKVTFLSISKFKSSGKDYDKEEEIER